MVNKQLLYGIASGLLTVLMLQSCNHTTTSGNTQATPRRNFLNSTKVDLITFDTRPSATDLEIRQLDRTFYEHLVKSYPRAWVRVRDRDAFFKEPYQDVVTVRVKIQDFGVTERPILPDRYQNNKQNVPNAPQNPALPAFSTAPQAKLVSNVGSNVGAMTETPHAVMQLFVSITDKRNGKIQTVTRDMTEIYPVKVKENGLDMTEEKQIVLQRSMEKLCSFIDATLWK
ncbi:MAG: hypothetical protein RIS64_2397 [Bacteroidota bacterium]|jgi:hypothetical protein